MRGIRVSRDECPRTGHFACRNTRARARPANHDGAIHLAAHNQICCCLGIVGVVNGRRRRERPEVDKRQVGFSGKPRNEELFEIETGVI